jgi:hypothetical protein
MTLRCSSAGIRWLWVVVVEPDRLGRSGCVRHGCDRYALSPPAIAHRDDGLRRHHPPGETRTCAETPDAWSHCYGDETSEVRLHSGNGPHQEMDRRAIASFDQALVDVGRQRRPAPTGAARLLRLDDPDHDLPIPPVRRRCPGRAAHPAVVAGRTCRGVMGNP